eukprot:SAG31_NODE_641_length_13313_cov_5.365219_11_plen_198_part_01
MADDADDPDVTNAIGQSTVTNKRQSQKCMPRGGGSPIHMVLQMASRAETDAQASVSRLKKLADCGIFSSTQLVHTLKTRASKGCNLPYNTYFNGRQLLLNELIASCSSGPAQFEHQANVDSLLEVCEWGLQQSDSIGQRGAPVDLDAEARLEPPLAMSLMVLDRLDIRAPLARAGMTGVGAFMAATDQRPAGVHTALT